MKKTLSLLFLIVVCVSFVFAQGAKEQAVSTEGKTEEPQHLTIMLNDGAGTLDGMQAMVDAFQKKTGIICDVEVVPSGDEGEEFTKVRLATGALADIYLSNAGAKMYELSPADNLYDLEGESFIHNLNDVFIQTVTFDGKVYGVPAVPCGSVGGVFYNKRIYKELGLSIPKTWNDFLGNCEVIKKAGLIPVANPLARTSGKQLPFLANYFYAYHANPSFATDYQNRKIKLSDSPEYVRGLQKMYDIQSHGYLDPDAAVEQYADIANMIGKGKAVHTIYLSSIIKYFEEQTPDNLEDIGFYPMPDEDPNIIGVTQWMPQCFVMNKNAKNSRCALQFLSFICSPEAVDAFANNGGSFNGGIFIKGASLPANVPTVLKEVQEWSIKSSAPAMEFQCNIKGSNQATICAMVSTGMMTPEEAIKEIEKDNAVDAHSKGLAGW